MVFLRVAVLLRFNCKETINFSDLECEKNLHLKIYQGNASNCRVSCYCCAWHKGYLVRPCLALGLAAYALPGIKVF